MNSRLIVYHEVDPDTLSTIEQEGIKRQSRGSKSDGLIDRTDRLLDESRPPRLRQDHVSRRDSIYGYVTSGETAINITDGEPVSAKELFRQNNQAVLALSVDPEACYVSDLDAYDAIKAAVAAGSDESARQLADGYWQRLVRLDHYEQGSVRRPEVMITYDVAPNDIRVLYSGQ